MPSSVRKNEGPEADRAAAHLQQFFSANGVFSALDRNFSNVDVVIATVAVCIFRGADGVWRVDGTSLLGIGNTTDAAIEALNKAARQAMLAEGR